MRSGQAGGPWERNGAHQNGGESTAHDANLNIRTESAYGAGATMPAVKRLLAAASLLILGITETAPHRQADSLDLWLGDEVQSQAEHVIRCDGPAAGATHMHRDAAPQADSCLACFRQHMQATASRVALTTPTPLQQFIAIAARVACAHAIQIRKSSRAPPVLPS